MNRYPVDKYWQNKPRHPLHADFSSGYPPFEQVTVAANWHVIWKWHKGFYYNSNDQV